MVKKLVRGPANRHPTRGPAEFALLHRRPQDLTSPDLKMRSARGSSSTLGWSRSWCAARRIATRRAVLLNLPSCIDGLRTLRLRSQLYGPFDKLGASFAFLTGADFAQEFPRVNAKVVVIVPLEPYGVLAHAFGGNWFGRGFEQGQRA